jgi:hypothetical protein
MGRGVVGQAKPAWQQGSYLVKEIVEATGGGKNPNLLRKKNIIRPIYFK